MISPTTLNSVRFALNRTDISRTSTDFFSAPEVGINIYSYMPHYMLLTVTNGFSLGGGTESLSTFTTNAWQVSDDVTLVRGGHQFALGANFARWKSLSLANVRSPGQLTRRRHADRRRGDQHRIVRLPVGTAGGTNALVQAAPIRSTWRRPTSGCTRRTRGGSGSRLTVNYGVRWEPFFPQQLQNGAVYQFDMTQVPTEHPQHGVPERTGRPVFPGRPRLPDQGGHEHAVERISDLESGSPGIRPAAARRRFARRTASRTSS